MWQRNESTLDRVVRAVAGGGLVVSSLTTFGLTQGRPFGVVFGLVGAVLLFTAATGVCLIYKLAGIDTAKQH